MIRILKNFLKIFTGKKRFQSIFKNIHRISLYGMNYNGVIPKRWIIIFNK